MRVLVVDDDRSIRRSLEKFLQSEGYEVRTAEDGNAALAEIDDVDIVLLDLGLPHKDGFEVLTEAKARAEQRAGGMATAPSIVVVSARDDMQSTVRAVQLGAFEYIVKPIDIDLLRLVMRRAIDSRETSRRVAQLTTDEAAAHGASAILGKSSQMRDVYKQIGAVSRSKTSVLVVGESGTGKELVAKAIHYASDPDKPFVAVNCTAFASGLLESELFGHVRGAYTGAVADRMGRFELAGQGSLFLDEIAEIPLDLQAKLLRVLQERTFERVGDARPVPLRARVMAATHRDLAAMVREGTFREDLFYRLNVVEIRLPALRDRPDDIPLLVEGLLARINRELHRNVRHVTGDAMHALTSYAWPGNVRELENTLTRAVVLAKGDAIDLDVLSRGVAGPPEAVGARHVAGPPEAVGARHVAGHVQDGRGADDPLAKTGEVPLPLREVERLHIEYVLRHAAWNKKRTCELLEISRPTLDRKIEEYGLKKE
jgi:two-component system, NtrC family, response regulator AtoC